MTALVSIGMPVYNEERFLRRALDSLLSQTFSDFEIFLSDNASTDGTGEIGRRYAKQDLRIHYHRNETNEGSIKNFNRVFQLSRGRYFMWAAADDQWDSSFLTRCVEVMNSDPEVVLVHSQTLLTDDEGHIHGVMPGRLDTRGYDLIARFHLCFWGYIFGNHIYGLIRSEALRQTRLFRNMLGVDMVLLAELSLQGAFAYVDEPLFYRRRIRKEEGTYERHKRWLENIDPANRKRRVFFPGVRLLYEHVYVAMHAPVSWVKRLFLSVNMITSFTSRYGKQWLKPLVIRKWSD